MADTVTSTVIWEGPMSYIVRLTNLSDGTGESLVNKVVRASRLNGANAVPAKLNVRSIEWTIGGFASVRLFWDHTTPDIIDVLAPGPGYRDYSDRGGVIADPGSAGGTGNIQLTTNGAIAGATYDILLHVLKSQP